METTGPGGAAAGWYPDPWGAAEARWWDGAAWTGWTPEQAALAVQPPAGPGLGGLQRWARAAVVAYPLVQLAFVLAVLGAMSDIRTAVHQYQAQVDRLPSGQTPVLHLHLPAYFSLLSFGQLAVVALAVPFLVWQHRAATGARRRGYPATVSPGLGVGAWFIPVVSFWVPYQALRDCLPPGHGARRLALPAWLAFLAGGVVGGVAAIVAYFSIPAGIAVLLLSAGCGGLLVINGWRLIGAVAADQAEATPGGQPPVQGGWQISQA